jgi:hypothetical protein
MSDGAAAAVHSTQSSLSRAAAGGHGPGTAADGVEVRCALDLGSGATKMLTARFAAGNLTEVLASQVEEILVREDVARRADNTIGPETLSEVRQAVRAMIAAAREVLFLHAVYGYILCSVRAHVRMLACSRARVRAYSYICMHISRRGWQAGATKCAAVATAVYRTSENGGHFISDLSQDVGVRIQVCVRVRAHVRGCVYVRVCAFVCEYSSNRPRVYKYIYQIGLSLVHIHHRLSKYAYLSSANACLHHQIRVSLVCKHTYSRICNRPSTRFPMHAFSLPSKPPPP